MAGMLLKEGFKNESIQRFLENLIGVWLESGWNESTVIRSVVGCKKLEISDYSIILPG